MPLIPGSTKEIISQNIAREVRAGKPQKQAVAIAINNAKRTRGRQLKRKKKGSAVAHALRGETI